MDSGGHSLLVMQLVQRAALDRGKTLPLRLVVLENFATLAAHLETQPQTLPAETISAGTSPDKHAATFMQLYAHPRLAELDYVICNFDYGGRIPTEFNDTVAAQGYNLQLLSQRFGLDPQPIRFVQQFMREHGYNVIETHGYKGHIIGYCASRFAGTPWIAVAHGWTAENWKIKVYNALERWLLKRADAAVGVSPPLHETLVALRGNKDTHLVFNAIDLQEPVGHKPTGESLTLGVIGRLSPEKGQDVMLDALPAVVAQHPGTRLRMIGDGQERAALEAQTERLGLSDVVEFTGWRSDMPEQYAQLDALVLSSRSEGLPFAVLEAMSYGLPVIATRVGAIDHVIEDGKTGWIVAPGESDALAAGINQALGDLDNFASVGKAGRASLHPKFSPDQRAETMLALYTEMANRRG